MEPGNKAQSIYIDFLFDASNEALNYIRPYGTQGEPLPWSLRQRSLLGDEDLIFIFKEIETQIKKWSQFICGLLPNEKIPDEKLKTYRNELLATLLKSDITSETYKWLDQEDEELQVILDLTDIILDSLCGEAADILQMS